MSESNRIVIVGAGVSGLVAARWLLEYDPAADITILEYHDQVGGVWDVSRDHGVMDSTVCNVSKYIMELNGFPWPANSHDFPHQSKVLEYIQSYVAQFKLFERTKVMLNTLVTLVRKANRKEFNWKVITTDVRDGTLKQMYATHVIVANGHSAIPNYPANIVGLQNSGTVLHSCNFKSCKRNNISKKSVLVVGLSFSAVDAAVELKRVGDNNVTVVLRAGCWFGQKNDSCGKPNDLKVSRVFLNLPSRVKNLLMKLQFTGYFNQNNWQISNKVEPIGGQFVVSELLVELVKSDAIKIKHSSITRIHEKEVTFSDGTNEEFDNIVFCTGYKIEFPFLEESVNKAIIQDDLNLYKNILCPEYEDTLTFIGLFNVRFTSPWAHIELQSRYISSLINGQTILPPKLEMLHDIAKHGYVNKKLEGSHRSPLFVSACYRDDLAKMIGCYPDVKLWKGLRQWIQHYFGPVTWAGYSLVRATPGFSESGQQEMDRICEVVWGRNWFYRKLVGPGIVCAVVFVCFVSWAIQ